MEVLGRMNNKMDQGYKVTNVNCTFCNGVTMTKPGNSQFYCPKCNKEYEPEQNEEEKNQKTEVDELVEIYNKKKLSSAKSEQVSKKIGQKLIQGWAMLDESCLECHVPLMKPKKGGKICFGCDKDFAAPLPPLPQKPKLQDEPAKKKQVKIQNNPPAAKNNNQRISQIVEKSLEYLERKLNKAIEQNDLTALEKVLDLVGKVQKIEK